MGKSTISMAIFNSYVKLPEGNHQQPILRILLLILFERGHLLGTSKLGKCCHGFSLRKTQVLVYPIIFRCFLGQPKKHHVVGFSYPSMLHAMNPHSDSLGQPTSYPKCWWFEPVPTAFWLVLSSFWLVNSIHSSVWLLYIPLLEWKIRRFPASDSQDQAARESWVDLVGHGWCWPGVSVPHDGSMVLVYMLTWLGMTGVYWWDPYYQI